jgi:deoxyribose-phosphate aldolase
LAESVVKLIDHAVLHPTQTEGDLRAACELCAELGVASVCVKPSYVPLAVQLLNQRSASRSPQPPAPSPCVSTVIGFPHGGTTTAAKITETNLACDQGAREVDMVVNIGQVLAQNWVFVDEDIRGVVDAARRHGVITKVIFESGLLPTDDLKIRLCQISEAAGAAFVKTSTGFGFVKGKDGGMVATGATEHDVRLMRAHCGPAVQVKASGGIRSYEDARRFVDLGATRLGTSGTREIAAGEQGKHSTSTANY